MLPKSFVPLEDFKTVERRGYKLLPMRFTKLNEASYVVSNMVGQYRVLRREELQEVLEHRLASGRSLYYDLKAEHFIEDDDSHVARRLLALKYRSKRSRLPAFTALHLFVVTLRCDYTCKYCQVSRQTEEKGAFDMTEDMARAAIDLVFQSPSPAIKIEFQGGEPLLNFDRIKQVVELAEAKNAVERRDLQFVIATNLSLLTDEILDYCDSHSIHLSTSLDGPESLHNANRPRPGKNGYSLTLAGIERARMRLGVDKVSALMTTTERSLDQPRQIIDEYVRHGFRSIFLRPLSPYGFAIKTGQAALYDADRWLQFYKEGLNYILELNLAGFRMRETYAALILQKMLTPQNPGYVDLQSPSGAGISAIVYNYDGEIYASDEGRMLAEMGDKTFRLGKLGDKYEDIFLSDSLLEPMEQSLAESSPMCSECAFMEYCGSDPVYHHATQGSFVGRKAESGFCRKNMGLFKHLIELMESNREYKKILEEWAWR